MTDHNLFQEVEDDLERQRLEALWRRYGPYILAGALVVILTTGGITTWRNWHVTKNQTATAGLLDAVTHTDPDAGKQMAAFQGFALKNPNSEQAVIAQLNAASIAAKSGNSERAVQLYDEVAKQSNVDTALRQLAALYSVREQMDTADPVALMKRLEPLEAENAPWRFTAMELHAYLALHSGDKATVRKIFTELSQNSNVPPTQSARATTMLHSLSE